MTLRRRLELARYYFYRFLITDDGLTDLVIYTMIGALLAIFYIKEFR